MRKSLYVVAALWLAAGCEKTLPPPIDLPGLGAPTTASSTLAAPTSAAGFSPAPPPPALRDLPKTPLREEAPPTVPVEELRIVSLVPSATELLFALHLGEHVVGRSAHCDFPPAASAVPSVGTGFEPDLETLVALRPNLLVTTDMVATLPGLEELERKGLRVVRLPDAHLADIPNAIRQLGRATGTDETASSFAADFEIAVSDISGRRLVRRPLVAIVLQSDPTYVAGEKTLLGEMLAVAGGINAFAGEYAMVDDESFLAKAPEIIVDETPAGGNFSKFGSIPAIARQQICRVPQGILSRPGPRTARALNQLRDCIERFSQP